MKIILLGLIFFCFSALSNVPNIVRGPSISKPVVYGAIITDTGVVTEIGGANFINGNCVKSSTNNQIGTCTFNSNIWSGQPNCSATCGPGTACTYEVITINSTTFAYRTYQVAASTSIGMNIICFGLSGL